MGLDIYCKDCDKIDFRAGSYSGFHEWRKELANKLGINLDAMEGFTSKTPTPWNADTPFVELLHHSDCDEELTNVQCKQLLLDFAKYPDLDSDVVPYWRNRYISWFEAVVHSVITGHTIQFG